MPTAEQIMQATALDRMIEAGDLEPHDDRILVRRVIYTQSRGGIQLAGEIKSNFAKVLAVGPGKLRDDGTRLPMKSKVGDLILLPYGAQETKLESGDVIIFLQEVSIVCHVNQQVVSEIAKPGLAEQAIA